MPDYRVLVADDNPSMRKLLGMVLKQMGVARVDYAGNGLEVVNLHNANQYNMIILDNEMPEMTGIDLLRSYHDSLVASDTSVIMVTAVPDEEIVHASRNAEIRLHDMVVKPFDIQVMKDRIQRLIDRHRARGRPARVRFDGAVSRSVRGFTTNLHGKTLSLGITVERNVATVAVTGMFLNEDRAIITNFVKALPGIPGDTLLLDLSGVVGIDEFGLGSLLFVNGMAATTGKRTYLMAESSMVLDRIKAVGIPEIVPMCDQWPGARVLPH